MSSCKPKLLLFDVDGTLTKARQVIGSDMVDFLQRLHSNAGCHGNDSLHLAIVGGSDMSKISEQLGGGDGAGGVMDLFKYVFAENGLVAMQDGREMGRASMVQHLGESLMQRLLNFCLAHLANIELPVKRGNFIEFRNGMINVSPIGRSCSQKEREQFVEYESRVPVRQPLVQALQQEFADANLSVCIGGQISIDVFPTGWDKTYALKFLQHYDEIHFFGDRTAAGGNDHAIFVHERTIGHTVTDPSDTMRQVTELLQME